MIMLDRETYRDMCAMLEKDINYWHNGCVFTRNLFSATVINGDTMETIEQYALAHRRPLEAMVRACERAIAVLDMQAGNYDHPIFSECRPEPLTEEEETLIKQALALCYET